MKTYLVVILLICIGMNGCKSSKTTTTQDQTTTSSSSKITTSGSNSKHASSTDSNSRKNTQGVDVLVLNQNRPTLTAQGSFALPSVIIYKTKADYSKNVPVGLNDEKTEIISYPGKNDIKDQMPVQLEYGFLLDKRGINKNSAFLKYSYEEYVNLPEIPSIKILYNDIIDKDPFTEIYYCGKSSDFLKVNVEDQLNGILNKCNGRPDEFFKKLK